MTDFVKNILVFVLIVTVMKGIINNESFKMYFKFFSGLVLVLLMASPLISFIAGGDEWYKLITEAIFNFELDSVNDELNIADGKFEEIIREGCKEDIEEQVVQMAKQRGIYIKNIETKFDSDKDSIQLTAVDIEIDKGRNTENEKDSSIKIADIETINIMSDDSDKSSSNKTDRQAVTDQNAQTLKEDISSYFLIKEAAINIWE